MGVETVLTPAAWAAIRDDLMNDAIPEPTGWRMLVKPYEVETKTASGLILIDESKQYADAATYIGQVVRMGPDCYRGEKFAEPWCQVGDWVMFARHVGLAIEVKQADGAVAKYRMINDDDVRARVEDPSRIRMYL